MRITNQMIGAQLQRRLSLGLSTLARQQDHLAASKRLLVPSDDPAGAAQAVVTRSRQAAADQWTRNIGEARDRLMATDETLGSVANVLTRAHELAVQGANDTNDAQARQALGSEVDQILEGLVSLANTRRPRDEYLFGGQESTRAPYVATRDANGTITAVTPNARGIDGSRPAEVWDGLSVTTDVSGTAVFGSPTDQSYAFGALIRLRDSLLANEGGVSETLALTADVDAAGAANAGAYLGVDATTDLEIAGPSGVAFAPLTNAADDTVSVVGNSTSAIATAAAINSVATTTGVRATATAAAFSVADAPGRFGDITLGAGDLVINGQSIVVSLNAGNPTANRDAFVAAVNAASALTGVVATADSGVGYTLTAADGRNISIATAAGTGNGSVADEILGFGTALATETVVARGGVRLTASEPFTTTEFNTTDQIGGDGRSGGVGAALDDLAGALDRIAGPQAKVGGRLSWLDMIEERLGGESIALASTLSRIEDLDVPKAVQELQQTQISYQAALQSGANLLNLSLLDFLR
jgi:flagellar hook-associated protein 3